MRRPRRKAKAPSRPALGQPTGKVQELIPPEGVPLRFQVATLGARFGAQFLDILITTLPLVVALFVLGWMGVWLGDAGFAVIVLFLFMMRAPYYIFAELVWNGQTPGKRVVGIRTVSGTGRSLTVHQVVARNLMREMEIFVPGTMLLAGPGGTVEGVLLMLWIAILLIVPLRSPRNQRLGDIIANTHVVEQPRAVLLPDLAAKPEAADAAGFDFLPDQLDHYGAYELQVLADLLQPPMRGATDLPAREQRLRAVGERIRAKIEWPEPVAPGDEEAFLRAFYRQQRGYLEQKKLFGDARADKFHRTDEQADPARP